MAKLKVVAGSQTFFVDNMEDLKKQAQAAIEKITIKLSAAGDNTEALKKLEEEKKAEMKKLNEKYAKKVKALTKDTAELQKDKTEIEKLLS